MTDLASVLAGTSANDKATREHAESALNLLLSQSVDEFAASLAAAMCHPSPSIALSAVVIFRRKVLEERHGDLGRATHLKVRETVLGLIAEQQSTFFLKRLGDVITSLAVNGGWIADIPGYISAWGTSGTPHLKELAMYMIELATDYEQLMDVLKTNSQSLMNFLVESLKDSVFEVKSAAVKAVCALLAGFEESQVMIYSETLGLVLNIISVWVQTPDFPVDRVKSTFESLSDLTESVPKIWTSHLRLFATVVLGISSARTLALEVRLAAAETAATLLAQAPGLIKKNGFLLEEYVKSAVSLTGEVDDPSDLEAWGRDLDSEIVVENSPFSVGKDLLGKISSHCGQATLSIFLSLIPQQLKSEDWTVQHTGLLAIGLISPGCRDAFSQNLAEILGMTVPFFASEHPRLRWAGLTSVGILCGEFAPEIEADHHSVLVPAILTCMQTGNCVKVQIRAVSALVNYAKGVMNTDHKDSLGQYADQLFTGLTTLLESGLAAGCVPLLEEVLSVVSLLASALKSDFQLYYDRFMPGLKHLVSLPVKTVQEKAVRANCIRCMGYLIDSTADLSDRYTADAHAIYAGLHALKSGIEFDDPSYVAVIEVASFFVSALGEDFAGYMDALVSELIAGAGTSVDMSLVDASSPEAANVPAAMDSITLEVRGQGAKQFSLNTSALDTKTKSCRVLYDVVRAAGKRYSQWLSITVEAMVGLFECLYSSDVRKYAYKTVGACSGACVDDNETITVLSQLLPVLLTAIKENCQVHPLDTKQLLKTLESWCDACRDLSSLGQPAVSQLAEVLSSVVQSSLSRKDMRQPEIARLLQREMEGEELEEFQADEEIDDEILRKVMQIVGEILKAFKSDFQQSFLRWLSACYAGIFVKTAPSDVELLSAICLFDDYVEHTGDVVERAGRSEVLEQLLRRCGHQNPDVRQSAIYGVGVCAQAASRELWSVHRELALRFVNDYLQDPKARTPELTMATDCAVSSLGKIALTHEPSLIPAWLTHLPIKAEPLEAQAVHSLFLSNLSRFSAYTSQVISILRELSRLTREEPTLEVLNPASLPLLAQALSQLSSS